MYKRILSILFLEAVKVESLPKVRRKEIDLLDTRSLPKCGLHTARLRGGLMLVYSMDGTMFLFRL